MPTVAQSGPLLAVTIYSVMVMPNISSLELACHLWVQNAAMQHAAIRKYSQLQDFAIPFYVQPPVVN